jgi:Peptidase_C39 like family
MKKTNNIIWNVPFHKQLGHNWCWAACMQMIFNYHEPAKAIQQCTIVAKQLTKTKNQDLTCADVFDKKKQYAKTDFDSQMDLTQIDFVKDYNCVVKKITDKTLYWQTIKREIAAGRPLIADMSAHVVVIIGYIENTEDSAGNFYVLNNPKNDGFGIERFDSCGEVNIKAGLFTFNFGASRAMPSLLSETLIKPLPKRSQTNKLKKLMAFFNENMDTGDAKSIKLITRIINIDKDNKNGVEKLTDLPNRYDEILDNKVIGTFELCKASQAGSVDEWKKVKAKINNVSEGIIKQITVGKKQIDLLNTNFNPNTHPSILPIEDGSNAVQFEKIIFQPTVYRFYHIKMSEVDDRLTPLRDYVIDGKPFKRTMAYTYDVVLTKITNELDKKRP